MIEPRFNGQAMVYLYGSYSKGYARPESDIDVAVVVPALNGDWLEESTNLNLDAMSVSTLIEPVLITSDQWSPLYSDILKTGIAITSPTV